MAEVGGGDALGRQDQRQGHGKCRAAVDHQRKAETGDAGEYLGGQRPRQRNAPFGRRLNRGLNGRYAFILTYEPGASSRGFS